MRAIWHKVEQSIDWILKHDAIVFYALLVLHAAPLAMHRWFPTVDGPAHLYNAKLILDALTGVAALPSYLEIGNLTTNWLGHGILAFMLAISSAEWAETGIQLLQVLGLPLAFRFTIKAMGGNRAFAIMAFPYSYSFLFFYGFYNFNISLILALITLGVWWRSRSNASVGNRVLVMMLALFTGFAHIFGLAFLLMTAGLFIVVCAARKENSLNLKEAFLVFAPFIPSVALLLFFVTNATESKATDVFLPVGALWTDLLRIAPSKGIEYGKEGVFSQWILYLHLLMLMVLPFVLRKQERTSATHSISMALAAALLLCAYFVLPDGKEGYAGFVNARLLLLFFISLSLAMATIRWPKLLSFTVLFISTYISIGMLEIYINAQSTHTKLATALVNQSASIKPGSVVLPFIASDRFIYGHISGYAGVEQHIILLDNYEAALGYFPLSWKKSRLPNFTLNGQPRVQGCPAWPANTDNDAMEVDYVLLIEDTPSDCTARLRAELDTTHSLIYRNPEHPFLLYQKRP